MGAILIYHRMLKIPAGLVKGLATNQDVDGAIPRYIYACMHNYAQNHVQIHPTIYSYIYLPRSDVTKNTNVCILTISNKLLLTLPHSHFSFS